MLLLISSTFQYITIMLFYHVSIPFERENECYGITYVPVYPYFPVHYALYKAVLTFSLWISRGSTILEVCCPVQP